MYCDWPVLGRCCFCMPLRRGVLTFGSIQLIFSAIMIGLYSYSINYAMMMEWLISGRFIVLPAEICVAFYCFDLIFDVLLIYGAYKKSIMYLKAFYYYTMMTCVAILILEIVDVSSAYVPMHMLLGSAIEWISFSIASICLQIYLITLVRSLIKKLEISGPHVYDNQLHQIVSGEPKVECNGIYNNSTVVPN